MSLLNLRRFSKMQDENLDCVYDIALAASQILKDEGYWLTTKFSNEKEMENNVKQTGFHFIIIDDSFRKTGVFCLENIGLTAYRDVYSHCEEMIDNDTNDIKRALIFGKKFTNEEAFHRIKDEKRLLTVNDYRPIRIRTLQATTECLACQIS